MLSSLLLPLKMCFFFSLSLTDFLGGVHSPLCPKALSLYLSLSYSFCLSFMGHKERRRGRREVCHLDKEGHGEDSATKVQINREGGKKRQKGRCLDVLCSCLLRFRGEWQADVRVERAAV